MTGFSLYTHIIPQRCPVFSLRGLIGDQRVYSEPPEVFGGSWRAGNAPSGVALPWASKPAMCGAELFLSSW